MLEKLFIRGKEDITQDYWSNINVDGGIKPEYIKYVLVPRNRVDEFKSIVAAKGLDIEVRGVKQTAQCF